MKKWQRTLLVGFIWGYIFLWWFIRSFLLANWDFNFFEPAHWAFLVDEFKKGWVIKSTSDIIFFIVALGAFPLFLIGWHYCLRIEWLKLMRIGVKLFIAFFTGGGPFYAQAPKKIQLKKHSSNTTRPRPMGDIARPASKESELKVPVDEPMVPGESKAKEASFGGSDTGSSSFNSSFTPPTYTPPSDSPFNKGFSLPSMQQGFSIAPAPSSSSMGTTNGNEWGMPAQTGFSDSSLDNILLSDIKLPERTKLEENIPAIFDNAGYVVLQNMVINNQPIDYSAIGDTRIIVAVEDTQSGDWLADEERFNGEDPLWFSESSHRVSPVFQLLEAVKGFMERLVSNGFQGSVVPMFIERSGMIINAEDMQTTWKDLSVIVCRTDIGGPDELSSVTQSVLPTEKPSESVIDQVKKSL